MKCTLCASESQFFCSDRRRRYYRCGNCDLIIADPESQLSAAEEKKLYDFHENGPDDQGYRKFLAQLSEPLVARLKPGMEGLDYGCGPGPTLSLMLEQQGMAVSLYDIYYANDKQALQRKYDFVTCTEVVEHFRQPSQSWPELVSLLQPGGWLGIMTGLFSKTTEEDFCRWSYIGDPTHISFYTSTTMEWIAKQFNLQFEKLSDRVVLFKKQMS
ncbi:2-polyprenyl-3-methyl-5-hydroxy-6-metoxy-1,4-benzoquinol methylase [Idiomarina seosinensis]|uniref:2-polyprenyl-3-methyl-5-hydroxy-6-metoxy-1, 4-benzoquinol methylase n=1 Tax=Idiomarina seosinensis TaxID=281739 RepID=A0A432ZJQ9_9GAMM|nr:2-polyprenyl-3-methyl-5-hydroxy-6-metoxy-1,4-benzoquinol methylase [Idiomarina seosinensis]